MGPERPAASPAGERCRPIVAKDVAGSNRIILSAAMMACSRLGGMTRKASPLDSIRLSNALDALLRTTVTGMTKGVEGRRPVRVCGDRIAPPFVRKSYSAAKVAREFHREKDTGCRRSSPGRLPVPSPNRCRPSAGALSANSCRGINEFRPQSPILTILNGLAKASKRLGMRDQDRRATEVNKRLKNLYRYYRVIKDKIHIDVKNRALSTDFLR